MKNFLKNTPYTPDVGDEFRAYKSGPIFIHFTIISVDPTSYTTKDRLGEVNTNFKVTVHITYTSYTMKTTHNISKHNAIYNKVIPARLIVSGDNTKKPFLIVLNPTLNNNNFPVSDTYYIQSSSVHNGGTRKQSRKTRTPKRNPKRKRKTIRRR